MLKKQSKSPIEQDENIPDLEMPKHALDVPYTITNDNAKKAEIYPLLRSMNKKQSEIFYWLRDWCLKKVSGKKPKPFHIFVTGGA